MKLTIVVSVFNRHWLLNRCISSLLNQSIINDIELIIIDDGSCDYSSMICDNYAFCNPHKFIIAHKENKGVSNTRNLGIELASGNYIAFVDSDDWVENDFYEKLLIKKNDDVDLVSSGYTIETKFIFNRKIHSLEDKEKVFNSNQIRNILKLFAFNSTKSMYEILPVWNKIYKLEKIRNNRIWFDEAFINAEDIKFNIEYLINCNRIIITNNCGYHYNRSYFNKSLSKETKSGMFVQELRYYNLIIDLSNKLNDDNLIKDKDKYIINKAEICAKKIIKSNMNKYEKNNELKAIYSDKTYRECLNNFLATNYDKKSSMLLNSINKDEFMNWKQLIIS